MNQGIYGFPNINDPNLIDIKEFDVSGSYRIPEGTKLIRIHAIGGGGGGGSGRRTGAGGGNAAGGGGGGSGSFVMQTFLREQIYSSTLNIVIGAGGGGGAARTTDLTNGAGGIAGGATTISPFGLPGILLYSAGGGGGAGGTNVSGGAGAGRGSLINGIFTSTLIASISGSVSVSPTTFSITDVNCFSYLAKGGGGGGSYNLTSGTISRGSNIQVGSANSILALTYQKVFTGDIIISGNPALSAQTDNSAYEDIIPYYGGMGGAGGASSAGTPAAATNGGKGYRGGGGGGGGGSAPGVNSGAGGVGGNGYVAIFCYK